MSPRKGEGFSTDFLVILKILNRYVSTVLINKIHAAE